MDGDLLGNLVTGAVAVVALWVQDRRHRHQLRDARDQHADTDREARRAAAWQRFEWACEQINSGDEGRAAPAWAVLDVLADDPETHPVDARMMDRAMDLMHEQQRRRREEGP